MELVTCFHIVAAAAARGYGSSFPVVRNTVSKSILLLLVEDEPMIMHIIEDALIEGGYEVLTALDGPEALGLMEKHRQDLAGLLTDIRLGGEIDGWAVARSGREQKPELAVIYMTGDSAADWAAQGVPKSVLLQKPFASAQVVTAISTLLTETDSSIQIG
ncbi:response regulator [Sphingomonas xinjiangensis]|uniref:CheY-like chemotaxis protein n=1 Tax=Sphingomonas xinjiangensis TaxID=643568 RepID=A0A840YSB4_9SPHN|nr:response regulator [Sphingomonas xinjiangensis]MBB5712568.1 CheY-like chemotaxis protein [Sphingomonas xinjiangensis]